MKEPMRKPKGKIRNTLTPVEEHPSKLRKWFFRSFIHLELLSSNFFAFLLTSEMNRAEHTYSKRVE